MAKDPAFLFYPNDYIGGTMGMTFEEKGAYMELLMMQFNRGHMTTHMIGQTVGQLWDKLQDKFCQDKDGLWFNERLEQEQTRRKNYSKSRRNNIKGKNQYTSTKKESGHINGHMTSHMENVNVNEDEAINRDKGGTGGKETFLTAKDFPTPWQDEVLLKLYISWITNRRQLGHRYRSAESERAALMELWRITDGSRDNALIAINQSIAAEAKNLFFDPRQKNTTGSKSTARDF